MNRVVFAQNDTSDRSHHVRLSVCELEAGPPRSFLRFVFSFPGRKAMLGFALYDERGSFIARNVGKKEEAATSPARHCANRRAKASIK